MKSNLNTTVEHAVMLARQQILSKPIRIEFHKTPDLPEVEHDSDQNTRLRRSFVPSTPRAATVPDLVFRSFVAS